MFICYRTQQKIHETHKIWHPSQQNYLFLHLSQSEIEIFPGSVQTFWKYKGGGEGAKLWGPILENSEGMRGHIANPFRGGGMDIFWNHKIGRRDVDLHRQLWVVQVQMD